MSKIVKTVVSTLLITMTVCGTAFAAPISDKSYTGDYMYNGEDMMYLSGGTEIEFFKDPLYGVFKNVTKVMKRVTQTDGGNTIKYNINSVTNSGAPNTEHSAVSYGDTVEVSNIVKEGTYNNTRVLYSNGPVEVKFNTPCFRFRNIVKYDGYMLDDNGNIASATMDVKYHENGTMKDINEIGLQQNSTEYTHSFTEPGVYSVITKAPLEKGIEFFLVIDKYYDNGGQNTVVNDNKAVPGTLSFCVNGNWTTDVPVYTMNGSKYIKVRALGKLLKGTSKQFNPYYNAGSKCTNLNQIDNPYRNATNVYQEIGGEFSAIPSTVIDNPQKTEGYFLINSRACTPSAFDIDGWTYVRLDHVAPLLGISTSMSDTGNMYITA